MNTTISMCALALAALMFAPQDPGVQLPERLPATLELVEDGPQRYTFTCDYLQTDAEDTFVGKHRIRATYIRDPQAKTVGWSDVRIAAAKDLEDDFGEGEVQEYMEGFTYTPSPAFKLFMPEFFQGFPNTPTATFVKNLVWDTYMLEDFGRNHFEYLALNQPHEPQASRSRAPLAGMGAFQNSDIVLTWIGVSKRNGEPCALIQYEAFFNRFEMKLGATAFEGSSHYWGVISVSLTDKQIEHATLNEQVAMKITTGDNEPRRYRVLRLGQLTRG
jgi:hypothetical protein